MDPRDAIDFIRPAIDAAREEAGGVAATWTWADFGAGTGTFSRALATLLGPDARVLAVDRDPDALRALHGRGAGGEAAVAAARDDRARSRADARSSRAGRVVPVIGDFEHPDAISELRGVTLDGALFANALHFCADAALVLRRTAGLLRPGGRIVVIEYDDASPDPWLPHPLPPDRLRRLAARAGLAAPEIVARRPSRYRGAMYCAVARQPH